MSDIPTDPMSHNDPIKDILTFGLADLGYPTADTVRRAQAYYDILTDLIAELRELGFSPYSALDRAEARLREVTGDE